MNQFPHAAFDVRDCLASPELEQPERIRILSELRQTLPDIANVALCLLYGVWAYKLGESVFAESAPQEGHSGWFIAVDVDSSLELGKDIPLAENIQHAFALAVEHYRLFDLFKARPVVFR